MATAKFISKEQDWQNEQTRYWFLVNGINTEDYEQDGEYAVVESDADAIIIGAAGDEIQDRNLANKLAALMIVTDEMRGI